MDIEHPDSLLSHYYNLRRARDKNVELPEKIPVKEATIIQSRPSYLSQVKEALAAQQSHLKPKRATYPSNQASSSVHFKRRKALIESHEDWPRETSVTKSPFSNDYENK